MKLRLIKGINFLVLIIFLSGCKKDDNRFDNSFRVIKTDYFRYKQSEYYYSRNYSYSNNKIIQSCMFDEYMVDPDCDHYEYLSNYWILKWHYNWVSGQMVKYDDEILLLNNNRVVETVFEFGRETYSYNISGQIQEKKIYNGNDKLIFYFHFTYEFGRLIQILVNDYTGWSGGVDLKREIVYTGDEVKDIISCQKYDNEWIIFSKASYTYSFGNIVKIEIYNFANGVMLENSLRKEYKYDSFGNLIEYSAIDDLVDENNEKIVYYYEKGSGNYRQININDWWGIIEPSPN